MGMDMAVLTTKNIKLRIQDKVTMLTLFTKVKLADEEQSYICLRLKS